MSCEFCDGCCACHLNPPCSFCTDHKECDICGRQVCEDKVMEVVNNEDGDKIYLCPICQEVADNAD